MSRKTILLVLEKNPAMPSGYDAYACRGDGKGCKRNLHRNADSKKKCDDCVLAMPEETLEQLSERVNKGDA